MAPVTRGIANTDQQELVFIPGFLESFLSPGIPIDRIMSVLKQVRAALMDELIGVGMFHISCSLALHQPYTKGKKEGEVSGSTQEAADIMKWPR